MTTSKSNQPRIRPLLGYTILSDGDLLSRGVAVLKGMTGNPAFLNPPVDLTAFNTALERYSVAIADALDGGQKAVGVKHQQRAVVIKDLRLLGAFVEANCNGDMGIFASSGFVAASNARVTPPPPSQPIVRKVEQGKSGQLLVAIKPVYGARGYDLRYAGIVGGVPGPWTIDMVTTAKTAVPIDSLTPGTTYAFQVRALGKLGYTNWSDSVTRMCI